MHSALPVAEELIDGGDQAVFYTTPAFAPAVQAAGAEYRPLGPAPVGLYEELSGGSPLSSMADVGKVVEQLGPLTARLLVDGLRAVPALIDGVRAERADRIVYNTMCPWGLALARMLGLPAVTFSTTFVMKPGSDFEQMFASAAPDAMADMWLAVADAVEQLHTAHGIPRLRVSDMIAPDERLNLVPITRQFQPDADGLDERYVFIGPSIRPRSVQAGHGDFPLERLDRPGGRPVVYVSLGTHIGRGAGSGFARLCFEAFAGSRWQVVLATGRGTDPRSLGPIPANVLVHAFVPQLEVLQRADVFVTHGGVNSVQESIWYGVPMVGIPHTIEQLVNTGRVAELGLGVQLQPGTVTAAALREAVDAVGDDPGYRTRLASASSQARAAGGYRRAADVIRAAAPPREWRLVPEHQTPLTTYPQGSR